MKKNVLWMGLLALLCAVAVVSYRIATAEQRAMASGDRIVQMIGNFKAAHGQLPKGLNEMGMVADNDGYLFEGIRFYYMAYDSDNYELYYLKDFDTANTFHPLIGEWDRGKALKLSASQHRKIINYIHSLETSGLLDSIVYDTLSQHPIVVGRKNLVHARIYYPTGSLAEEGNISFYDDPEDDLAEKIGNWNFFTQDRIVVQEYYKLDDDAKIPQ
uniref:Uncharacterized protein n=4 Tax=unclassified Prevotella TaxID=2638335 RepID=A0AB33JJV0_9BACT